MVLDPDLVAGYVDRAFERMVSVAERVGPERVNVAPHGEGTNAIGAVVVHCLGVCEFWLGHVMLGRRTLRQRDLEFTTEVTLDELAERVTAGTAQIRSDLSDLSDRDGEPSRWREMLPGGGGDDDVVVHVIEELYQHLGHVELTADALLSES